MAKPLSGVRLSSLNVTRIRRWGLLIFAQTRQETRTKDRHTLYLKKKKKTSTRSKQRRRHQEIGREGEPQEHFHRPHGSVPQQYAPLLSLSSQHIFPPPVFCRYLSPNAHTSYLVQTGPDGTGHGQRREAPRLLVVAHVRPIHLGRERGAEGWGSWHQAQKRRHEQEIGTWMFHKLCRFTPRPYGSGPAEKKATRPPSQDVLRSGSTEKIHGTSENYNRVRALRGTV